MLYIGKNVDKEQPNAHYHLYGCVYEYEAEGISKSKGHKTN